MKFLSKLLQAIALMLLVSTQQLFAFFDNNSSLVTLDQGWDESDREFFYFTPQGSPIILYDWFLALEQTNSTDLFRSDPHLKNFGLIPWKKSHSNIDALPIGMTIDNSLYSNERHLGINCAACHTSEVVIDSKTVLVDGGVSNFDLWSFMKNLLASMEATYKDSDKLIRFSERLGHDIIKVKARLRTAIQKQQNWHERNNAETLPGPGRADALNVILNQVTAKMISRPDNARPANAPASYPYIWDTPYLDFVQYIGVVPNDHAGVLARNVGQVLGVFGEVSTISSKLNVGYENSIKTTNLIDIEDKLKTLRSPSWKDLSNRGFLPKLNDSLVKKGSKIYKSHCASCHVEIDSSKSRVLNTIQINNTALTEIGTDPGTAMSYASRVVATGPLEGRNSLYIAGTPLCQETYANQILDHMSVAVIINDLSEEKSELTDSLADIFKGLFSSAEKTVADYLSNPNIETRESDKRLIERMQNANATPKQIASTLKMRDNNKSALYDLIAKNGAGFSKADAKCLESLETAQYRAKPLNGVWVTGPFLHNGSVPTLADLLEAQNNRPDRFRTGSPKFDPVKVGFSENNTGVNALLIDTKLPGNLNSGHEYGVNLSKKDKLSLLEYLKSL
ncbi:di-heme-cytochrome C peroxidase [Candidatus Thioglobus sp.]|nr:di-heme-cytochrome C peroxidase [Candidatus Thioglobus sp.]